MKASIDVPHGKGTRALYYKIRPSKADLAAALQTLAPARLAFGPGWASCRKCNRRATWPHQETDDQRDRELYRLAFHDCASREVRA